MSKKDITDSQPTESITDPKDSSSPHWIFDKIFIEKRKEILQLVEVYRYSVHSMKGMADLAEAIGRPVEHIDQVKQVELAALDDAKRGFPVLHSMAIVLLWAAVETTIRDFVLETLSVRPDLRQAPQLANLKIRFGEFEILSFTDKMSYLLDLYEKDHGVRFKPGIGKFNAVLSAIGITPTVSDEVRDAMYEFSAVRNVVAHRVGIADKRFADSCPRFTCEIGQPIVVTNRHLIKYVDSCSEYMAAVVRASQTPTSASK